MRNQTIFLDFNVTFLINSYLSLLASSMKGLFSPSNNNFHSAPNLLLISELCILGLSCAIFLL